MSSTRHLTYCRICTVVCGLQVEMEDGQILAVHGDREHPVTGGYLCAKGRASAELHNGEDRLISSRRRSADGVVADLDVESALDEISIRLRTVIDRWGPESVALYYGTGTNMNTLAHSAMKAWMAGLGSPYIFSSMTLDQSAKWVTMGRMGRYLGGKHSTLDADVIMLVGVNPTVSHGTSAVPAANPRKWIREAQQAGMKLIVVDPRETETAKLADVHVRSRPGEDATLFAGLIRIVLDRGLYDREFCDRFVGPLDALRVAVADFDEEYVAARTGVSVDMLNDIATVFATAASKSVASGTGPNMASDSNLAEHLIEAFNALCGGYRQVGEKVWNTGGIYGSPPTVAAVVPPARSWEQGPKCKTADIGPIGGEYPTSLLPAEILDAGEQRIRALVVIGGDLARAMPDPDRTLPALDALELLVTVDQRPTDTGARAHYEIATSLPYERHDLTGAVEIYFAQTFARVATPLLERPPGYIDDWEFFWGLARRMGTPMQMKQALFGVPHDQIPGESFDLDPAKTTSTQDIVRWMCGLGELSYEELLANPRGIARDRESVVAAVPDDGSRLDLCPDDIAAELTALHRRHRQNEEFPMRLLSRRMPGVLNSAFRRAAKTTQRTPWNPAYMNPQDMQALGVHDASPIVIESEAGVIQALAREDDSLPTGSVSMTHAWGALVGDDPGEAGTFTGRLISLTHSRQTINYMPRLSAIPIRVIKPSA
jgi:anaerobic selenocysteine-containing dehydrogenase